MSDECMHASVCEHGGGWCEDSCPDYEVYTEEDHLDSFIADLKWCLYEKWLDKQIRVETMEIIKILVELVL